MRDATEYQFVAGDRRLMVRPADPASEPADLPTIANAYAARWEEFLGATEVKASEPMIAPTGADVVRVSATLPEGLVRAALLRFPSGPVVELALTAPRGDATADTEFERVLASARPASASATEAVAHAVAAGPRGTAAHPVGPLMLDLGADYVAPTSFVLASPDGGQRYTFEPAAMASEDVVRSAGTAPILAEGLAAATGEDGRPVRYEIGPQPRRYSRVGPAPTETIQASGLEKGPGAAPPQAPGSTVSGTVHGTPVRVRFAGPGTSAQTAEALLRALNAAT